MMFSPKRLLAVSIAAIATMTSAHTQAQTAAPPGGNAVHVVTYLDIAPSQLKQARQALRQYRAASAKEAGGSGVEIFQEIGRPGRIVVRETWASQQAFDGHGTGAAAKALASGLEAIQLAPPDQRLHLSFAAGNGPAKAGGDAVYVFSHVDVPPPKQPELEPLLAQLQAASTKAATSIRFDVLQQSSRKNHFTVVEGWQSLKALDAQALAPAQRDFRAKLGPMLGALYDQRIYKALE